MKILDEILHSFDNNPNSGFSARKLSAFVGVTVAIYLSVFKADVTVVVELVMAWMCFILLCLGLITTQQIVELKNGKQDGK
jgi:succinate-acetate transporter protein